MYCLEGSNSTFTKLESLNFTHVNRTKIDIEPDITRWCEDMDFIFEWLKQYFTNEHSEWVKYCFHHEEMKFISSNHRVIFFLLYRLNAKSGKWRQQYLHWWGYEKCVSGYFLVKHSLPSLLIRKILFSSLKDTIHIFGPRCQNILYMMSGYPLYDVRIYPLYDVRIYPLYDVRISSIRCQNISSIWCQNILYMMSEYPLYKS